MKTGARSTILFLLFNYVLFSGYALPYNYSFTPECLANPLVPQYNGGIVVNPEFNDGLKGWNSFGSSKIEMRVSEGGNKFIVSSKRWQPDASFSQNFHLKEDELYTFSAWLQVGYGKVEVAAMLRTLAGDSVVGWAYPQSDCWSMLKGGFMVNVSGPADIYFRTLNSTVDLWADSISLQPFTEEEWRSHQIQSVEKNRKRNVKFQAIDAQGNPLANAKLSIKQRKPKFLFGNVMNSFILNNKTYQNWFTSRFQVTTFENEMKWASNEPLLGQEHYLDADAMLQFAKTKGIGVRGHTIFWADMKHEPKWVESLSPIQLSVAAEKRIKSIMTRYKGQVISWDVDNENVHHSFIESKLGRKALSSFYQEAHLIDSKVPLFLNEYNTIEDAHDEYGTTVKYREKIKSIRRFGYDGPLGIGLQGHFKNLNLPYMRAALDELASLGLPIWISELDVMNNSSTAMYLREIIAETHAHPAVNGIVMWASWTPKNCWRMCLTDDNFINLPPGDVVDNFIYDWTHKDLAATTDDMGFFEASLFHGDYDVRISDQNGVKGSKWKRFKVALSNDSSQRPLVINISVWVSFGITVTY